MPSRAERRRELRAAGYRRSNDKSGRRNGTRVAALEPTAAARTAAIAAHEEAQAAARSRIIMPGAGKGAKTTESGLVVPK